MGTDVIFKELNCSECTEIFGQLLTASMTERLSCCHAVSRSLLRAWTNICLAYIYYVHVFHSEFRYHLRFSMLVFMCVYGTRYIGII